MDVSRGVFYISRGGVGGRKNRGGTVGVVWFVVGVVWFVATKRRGVGVVWFVIMACSRAKALELYGLSS